MMRHFDQDLVKIKETLLTMGSHAESAVSNAFKALVDRDETLARRVIDDDSILDQYEVTMDEMAVNFLALQGPVAMDLRLVTVAMKVSHDLERVGDEATKMARRGIELGREPQLTAPIDLAGLVAIALEMLKQSLDAFVHGNVELARTVIGRDKEANDINKINHSEMVKLMIAQPDTITRCLNLMVISKSLERIADHATNIAEEVVYLYEGHDIRHTGKGNP